MRDARRTNPEWDARAVGAAAAAWFRAEDEFLARPQNASARAEAQRDYERGLFEFTRECNDAFESCISSGDPGSVRHAQEFIERVESQPPELRSKRDEFRSARYKALLAKRPLDGPQHG